MSANVSFEIFPPRSNEASQKLDVTISRLVESSPDFISVTFGAGGSTQSVSINTANKIARSTNIDVAGHLTCVDMSRRDVHNVVEQYCESGVSHIVALRGDPKTGIGTQFQPHPDGFNSAAELVGDIRSRFSDMRISVSAYPERHPESTNWAAEIENLKRKEALGANDAITQFFFDAEVYARYLERVDRAGIKIPVIAGILPIQNFVKTLEFSRKCGTKIPSWLAEKYHNAKPADLKQIAIETTAGLIEQLWAKGQRAFHIYSMNTADVPTAVLNHIHSLASPEPGHHAPKAKVEGDNTLDLLGKMS